MGHRADSVKRTCVKHIVLAHVAYCTYTASVNDLCKF